MKSAITGIVNLRAQGTDLMRPRRAFAFPKTCLPQIRHLFHASSTVFAVPGGFFISAYDHKSSNKT